MHRPSSWASWQQNIRLSLLLMGSKPNRERVHQYFKSKSNIQNDTQDTEENVFDLFMNQ